MVFSSRPLEGGHLPQTPPTAHLHCDWGLHHWQGLCKICRPSFSLVSHLGLGFHKWSLEPFGCSHGCTVWLPAAALGRSSPHSLSAPTLLSSQNCYAIFIHFSSTRGGSREKHFGNAESAGPSVLRNLKSHGFVSACGSILFM